MGKRHGNHTSAGLKPSTPAGITAVDDRPADSLAVQWVAPSLLRAFGKRELFSQWPMGLFMLGTKVPDTPGFASRTADGLNSHQGLAASGDNDGDSFGGDLVTDLGEPGFGIEQTDHVHGLNLPVN